MAYGMVVEVSGFQARYSAEKEQRHAGGKRPRRPTGESGREAECGLSPAGRSELVAGRWSLVQISGAAAPSRQLR